MLVTLINLSWAIGSMALRHKLKKLVYIHIRFRKLYYAYVELASFILGYREKDGIDVMEREWDNLIVLDACRYDTFEDVNDILGDLERVKSKATSTPQWLKRNFTDYYEDVVYVAGNPYVSRLAGENYFDAEEHFFHVDNVWDHSWDEDADTVTAEKINEMTRELKEKYPEKRFIIHYMQPHEPFIGDVEFDVSSAKWSERNLRWLNPKVKEAYRNNLDYVLESVEELLPELEGKTVITADHGEILNGKYGFVNHPKDVFLKELQEVPWLEVEK